VVELDARNTGPREVLALHRVLRTRGIDAIYADTPRDLRLAAYATLLRRCPIAYRYNTAMKTPRGDFGDLMFARAVGALVTLSAWVEEEVRRREPWLAARPIHRIPNGFDLELLRPVPEQGAVLRARLGLDPGTPTVLCASVFARGKRQEFLLEVLGRLRQQGRPVVCLLAGGTEVQATFRGQAEAFGVEVRWLGRPAPEELPAIYAGADVVAQPCAIETFGNVVGEAMACERAVVVPDAGAAPEVAGDAGVIVPAADVERWAIEIGQLLADPARRSALGRSARERVAGAFPLQRMQGAHVALFERLAAVGRS
ncbi:MAG: glycosyltransferase family 4 protein, partial [Actinomycetota bacterium]|nr:glycosyltransferase family 4 protein [Actinomycetota bacterium]